MAEQRFTDGIHLEQKGPSLLDRYIEMVKENWKQNQSLSGSLAALFREGVKDVRQTMNEVFFGQGEHMGEPGTPFNPTQIQVTEQAGNFHGFSHESMMEHAANTARFHQSDNELER